MIVFLVGEGDPFRGGMDSHLGAESEDGLELVHGRRHRLLVFSQDPQLMVSYPIQTLDGNFESEIGRRKKAKDLGRKRLRERAS